jgi:post-segregation antitoxin (ccd killing protein)
MGKIEIRVEVDTDVAARAREAGVMLGDAAELGLRIALAAVGSGRPLGVFTSHLRQVADPASAEAQARLWASENAEAIALHNARVAERGLFGEDLRRW